MKCEHCPVADGPCLGEGDLYRFFCSRAALGDPVERRAIADRSALASSGRLPPPDPPAPPAPPVPARPLAATLDLLEKVRTCAHRSDAPACGCRAMARCAIKQVDVSAHDCFACIESEGSPWKPRDETGAPAIIEGEGAAADA